MRQHGIQQIRRDDPHQPRDLGARGQRTAAASASKQLSQVGPGAQAAIDSQHAVPERPHPAEDRRRGHVGRADLDPQLPCGPQFTLDGVGLAQLGELSGCELGDVGLDG